ncbi:MAG: hypothetical protein K2K87_02760, partial [Lachnospiraceae bacterium]|nr:hypothetical protein [Lachnospiraceae bacterium]
VPYQIQNNPPPSQKMVLISVPQFSSMRKNDESAYGPFPSIRPLSSDTMVFSPTLYLREAAPIQAFPLQVTDYIEKTLQKKAFLPQSLHLSL